jgi:hypothetical protein
MLHTGYLNAGDGAVPGREDSITLRRELPRVVP